MKEEHLEQVPICCNFCAVSTNLSSAMQQATLTLYRDIAGWLLGEGQFFKKLVPTNFKLSFL